MAKKKAKQFRIKAAADAPDLVAHGNLEAEKKGGYYETDHERFADLLKRDYGLGHGDAEETNEDPDEGVRAPAEENTEDLNNG